MATTVQTRGLYSSQLEVGDLSVVTPRGLAFNGSWRGSY